MERPSRIPLKNLRHTFASFMIYDDINIRVVADALGLQN